MRPLRVGNLIRFLYQLFRSGLLIEQPYSQSPRRQICLFKPAMITGPRNFLMVGVGGLEPPSYVPDLQSSAVAAGATRPLNGLEFSFFYSFFNKAQIILGSRPVDGFEPSGFFSLKNFLPICFCCMCLNLISSGGRCEGRTRSRFHA